MDIYVQVLSRDKSLIGFSYNRGKAKVKDKDVIFHEFGIGFIIVSLYITVY